jgi:hypothetical protein
MKNGTHDEDDFTVERPSGMDQETWLRIKTETEALLARLVAGGPKGRGPAE